MMNPTLNRHILNHILKIHNATYLSTVCKATDNYDHDWYTKKVIYHTNAIIRLLEKHGDTTMTDHVRDEIDSMNKKVYWKNDFSQPVKVTEEFIPAIKLL